MAGKKERRQRSIPRIGFEPIRLDAFQALLGDASIADRIDGVSGAGQLGRPRHRSRSSEPIKMSRQQWLAAIACYAPLWDLAAELHNHVTVHWGPGRPWEISPFEFLYFEMMTWQTTGSARCAGRELADPLTWLRIAKEVEHAWPDTPDRRLSARGPSRGQHARFSNRHLDHELLEHFRRRIRSIQVAVAREIGICDPASGSFTNPHTSQVIAGDGTWIPSPFNTPPGYFSVDPQTGEKIYPRSDPDAVSYFNNDRAPGQMLVSALTRSPFANERIVLDIQFRPKADVSDATVFTDMVLELFEMLPGAKAAVYDMAIHAADIDRIFDAGRLAVSKVQLTKQGKLAHFVIGEQTFTLGSKTSKHVVTAVNGTFYITVVIAGDKYVVPLTLANLKRGAGGKGMYGQYEIPEFPGVPLALRGATSWIRMSSTADERAARKRRTRCARAISETDRRWGPIYGVREDTESMHNHMKQQMWGRRSSCVGLVRQQFHHHAYQLQTGITALIAWHLRTGGDISAYFGNWRPPGSAQLAAAA